MSQPVKLSDALVLDARQTGALAERSIAGQIEFWARLGRAVEPMLSGDRVLALRRAGDEQPLSGLIAGVESAEGQGRLAKVLAARPYPHYEPAAGRPGWLVRITAQGQRSVGRFSRGRFCEEKPSAAKSKPAARRPKS